MATQDQTYDDAHEFYAQATAPNAAAQDRAGFIFVHGRLMQIRMFLERDEAICSTLVFYNDEWGQSLDFATVATFNAHHLFRGGYCLVSDDESGSLYVNQSRRLSTLDADVFAAWLEDLGRRAATCSRWYAAERAKTRAAA